MRLVTWNINSVRLRLPLVKKLSEAVRPDILCLQETKCPDEHFPVEALAEMGYAHQHFHGMKSYNGVAILSRLPMEARDVHHRVGREDCRHIAASINGFELHNLYIPAGGDEPDVEVNDKFAHKLDFVDEMTGWFKDRYSADQRLIAVGDFNIAPYEHDVWSHKQLLNVVSHTPPETERLAKMKDSLDWIDVARRFIPEDEKCYTWWSYRNRDWKKSNRGRRLDHVWVTQGLGDALDGFNVLSEARDWEKPSDHAPVIVDFRF
ncbi:MAG: exodeoxyribonuclease III [Rhodospirillales bacterium]|nr:exodeoxyribonuclease III [Rhodospirillales bacterium]